MQRLSQQCVFVFMVLAVVVLQASSQAPGPVSCYSLSTTGCGSVMSIPNPQQPSSFVHVYIFNDKERSGTCRRPGLLYNPAGTTLQSATLNPCQCQNPACDSCVQNKVVADVMDCCGKTFTYTYYGQTYSYVDPTSKKPQCCMAEGSNAAGAVTRACYCQPGTEGCLKGCPVLPTARIAGGTPGEACSTGVIRFKSGDTVICNGVYAYHPTGTDSTGAKLLKPVVIVPKTCTDGIDAVITNPQPGEIQVTIGTTTFPYKPDEVTRTALANTYLQALTFKNYAGPCLDKPVCTYNKATMASLINKTDCSVLSFGADSLDQNNNPVYSGNLNTLPVYSQGTMAACDAGVKVPAECFSSVSLAAFTCKGDLGAPVMCSLTTGEKVLYGVFGQTTQCGPNNKVFPVVPVS